MPQQPLGIRAGTAGLGLGLNPGDEHYRAYVGPPQDYDLIAAMVFNLLTCLGLRQHHRLLDIGCGSLRLGRLFIPYLNPGHYIGVEPNRWLVEDGIANEIGQDLVRIKQPVFSFRTSLEEFEKSLELDFAVAQSIFSHCGLDLIEHWLSQVALHLKDDGALLATFLPADEDYPGNGWIYPGCVNYRPQTLATLAARCGLDFEVIDWAHPRQSWAVLSKKGHDKSLLADDPISWNRFIHRELQR
ncbi:class I SAM-dependent methyltransferase [Azotobacter armeniacus]